MRKNTGTKERAISETAAEASFVKTDFLKERATFLLFLVSARTPDSGRGKGGSWLCILSKEQALVPRHIQYRDFLKISLTFVQM